MFAEHPQVHWDRVFNAGEKLVFWQHGEKARNTKKKYKLIFGLETAYFALPHIFIAI